jgi:hypothetical protein
MKRRSFVQLNSLIGIGFLSGLNELFYAKNLKNWRFSGLDSTTNKHLDQLAETLSIQFENQRDSNKLIKDLLTPVEILKTENSLIGHDVIFKNTVGTYVRVFFKNGNLETAFYTNFPS